MNLDSATLFENLQPIIVGVKDDPLIPRTPATVELDLSRFHNGRWALQLDAVFARRSRPTIILAHGIACLAVAWWAQLSPRSYLDMVRGALFRSPLQIGFGPSGNRRQCTRWSLTTASFPLCRRERSHSAHRGSACTC